jgi:citrate lyase subunit beta / citryl-CoA lyase
VRLRSLLFVPGDRPERFAKAAASGADALILDLEDSVTPERKAAAREAVEAYLDPSRPGEDRQPATLVRVNPIDSPEHAADLALLRTLRPAGVVLPKAEGAASVSALGTDLPVLPIATETPAAIFQLGTYADVAYRLLGLTWGAEDLPAAIGASTSREADGRYTAPYELARSLTLFGAHAAGVAAIETVFPGFRELDALAAYAARGRRDGFTGMMAIHPAQVPVLNAAFTPSPDEVTQARRVVELFAANPGAGALQLDGRMVDAPHLKAARRLLALAAD